MIIIKRICAIMLSLLIAATLVSSASALSGGDLQGAGWTELASRAGGGVTVWTREDTSAKPNVYSWIKAEDAYSYSSGNAGKEGSLSNLAILCTSDGLMKFDFSMETENGKGIFAYRKDTDFTKASQVSSCSDHFTGDVSYLNNEISVTAGDVIYFSFLRGVNYDNEVDAVTISNLRIVNGGSLSVSSSDSTLGTVSWNASILSNLPAGTQVTVTATPTAVGQFTGWYETIGSVNTRVSTDPTFTYTVTEDAALEAVFIDKSTDVPAWSVNGSTYTDLNAAISAAGSGKTIVLARSGVLPAGNYTIPSGVKVLIPYDSSWTYKANPVVVTCVGGNGYAAPSNPYATLTMASGANITVASGGELNVGSQMASGNAGTIISGAPTGTSARIVMRSGSSIKVNGTLYAYGFITGNGAVTAEYGSSIHELFQICEHRGGTAMSNMTSGVFPFTQYYVQNIEAPITYKYGARETVHTDMYAGDQTNRCDSIPFLSNDNNSAILRLQSGGSVTRSYDPATDRITYDTYGTVSFSNVYLSMYGYSFNSSNHVLPLTSNNTINVNSGTLTFANDIELLPGVKMTVAEDAILSVASGKSLYVYDSSEWVGRKFVYNGRDLVPASYSPTRTYTRTASDLVDVDIDVNGTVKVNGTLLTTSSGANIHSSSGTGKVIFSAATPSGNKYLYQVVQNGTSVPKTTIVATSAKLHNADGSFTPTGGASAGDTYTWNAERGLWEGPPVTIKYYPNGGTGSVITETGPNPYSVTIKPANTFTRDHYTFAGWNSAANGSGTAYHPGGNFTFSTNLNLYAQWKGEDTTITWVDGDGNTLTTTTVEYGQKPEYTGVTPTKTATAWATYTFSGWSASPNGTKLGSLPNSTGDTTYYAVFDSDVEKYTIFWKYPNGTEIGRTRVEYNAIPTHDDPAPQNNMQLSFAGWSDRADAKPDEVLAELPPVTGSATYYAIFNPKDALPGDLDKNGTVNVADLNMLLDNYNKSGTDLVGDIDGNGTVNVADLNMLLDNYNKSI